MVVEAESLLNDGVAAVGFAVLSAVAAGASPQASSVVPAFLWTLGGGVLVGLAVSAAILLIVGRTEDQHQVVAAGGHVRLLRVAQVALREHGPRLAVLRAMENAFGITTYLGCASGTKPGGGSCPAGSTADVRAALNW